MAGLLQGIYLSFLLIIKKLFLPVGYPHSVSPDYLEYQIWDTIQALASSVTGALAAQAMLVGVGVGDAQATVLGASLAWMLKDGAGMVGKIAFVGWKGNYLDCECKRWRFIADVLNDCALLLELSSPFFPVIFTPIVCIANILKSIVSVAGGATRSAIILHQARENNVADVAAKDGSQETLSNLVALLFNLAMVFFVTGNWGLIWFGFFLLTAVHLYANYQAVRCLQLTTFNRPRFHIAVQSWLERSFATAAPSNGSVSCAPFPSISWVNKREPIVVSCEMAEVRLDCDIQPRVHMPDDHLSCLKKAFAGEKYILYCQSWKSLFTSNRPSRPVFHVALLKNHEPKDQIMAMLHVELIMYLKRIRLHLPAELTKIVQADSLEEFSQLSLRVTQALFEKLNTSIAMAPEPRWRLDAPQFGVDQDSARNA